MHIVCPGGNGLNFTSAKLSDSEADTSAGHQESQSGNRDDIKLSQ